jgi:hypothetical protein
MTAAIPKGNDSDFINAKPCAPQLFAPRQTQFIFLSAIRRRWPP